MYKSLRAPRSGAVSHRAASSSLPLFYGQILLQNSYIALALAAATRGKLLLSTSFPFLGFGKAFNVGQDEREMTSRCLNVRFSFSDYGRGRASFPVMMNHEDFPL